MSQENNILAQKRHVEKVLLKEVEISEDTLLTEMKKREDTLSLPIKVLIILGALLAGLFFIGFLAIAGFLDAELGLLFVSFLMLALAFITEIKYPDNIASNAFNLTFYIIGFSTLGAAFAYFNFNSNISISLLMILSIVVLVWSKNHITTFSATIGFHFLFFLLIITNSWYDLLNFQVIILLFMMYFLFFHEAKFIKLPQKYRNMYLPVRGGVTISLVGVLTALGLNRLVELDLSFLWTSSIVILFFIGYIFYSLDVFGTEQKTKIVQTVVAVTVLTPLLFAPAVLGGILIMLLSFRSNYTTGLTLGIACFLYFIGQFYYDLKMTLLTKSLLMMGTGLLFLIIQFILHKNKRFDEVH